MSTIPSAFCIFVVSLCCSVSAFAQGSKGASVCQTIMQGNIHDTNSVYSEQFHFAQYQNILKTAHFTSYSQYTAQGANLGIDLPIADALIDFSGDYQTDDSTFQQQMNTFLNSTYNESATRSLVQKYSSKIDSDVMTVEGKCIEQMFQSNEVTQSLSVEPSDYSTFNVTLIGHIPPPTSMPFALNQIEPSTDVQCTSNGRPLKLRTPATPQISFSSPALRIRLRPSVFPSKLPLAFPPLLSRQCLLPFRLQLARQRLSPIHGQRITHFGTRPNCSGARVPLL